MTVKEILSLAFVVSDQPDRLAQFRDTFRAVGLDPSPVRVWRACRIEGEGSMGNAIAQYSLVRHAQAAGFPWLFVFEDDACPSDDAPQELERAFNERAPDCLCLSLGWTWDSDADAGRDRSQKRRVYGSHAYALFGQEAYSAYCAAWERNGRADVVLGNTGGSFMLPKSIFKQHTVGQSIHLPAGWGIDPDIEAEVNREQHWRFVKAAEAVAARRRATINKALLANFSLQ